MVEREGQASYCQGRLYPSSVGMVETPQLYKHIELNEDVLEEIGNTDLLLFHVEHVLPSDAQAALQSRYDSLDHEAFMSGLEGGPAPPSEIPFSYYGC